MNNTCDKCNHKDSKQCEKCCYNWKRLEICKKSKNIKGGNDMDFKEMFESQVKLDKTIIENTNVVRTEKELHQSNVLSIIAEISETANATRCFKFWSKKGPMRREIILDEIADVLHFLLSLGNKFNHDIVKTHKFNITCFSDNLIEQFIYLNVKVSNMMYSTDLDVYYDLFDNFLGLVALLGFTFKELENGYYKKHEINYKRQESGY